MVRFLDLVYGLMLFASIVFGAVVMVSLPQVWRPLHEKVMTLRFDEYKGGTLTERALRDGGRISDGLWSEEDYGAISAKLELRKMNAKEIAHYGDVRGLLATAKWLAIGSGLIGVTACGIRGRKKVFHWALVVAVLILGAGGVWAVVSWRNLFRTLHWWVFQDDSWILPDNSYSLGLFPYVMWQAAAVVVIVVVGVVLLLGAFVPERRKK